MKSATSRCWSRRRSCGPCKTGPSSGWAATKRSTPTCRVLCGHQPRPGTGDRGGRLSRGPLSPPQRGHLELPPLRERRDDIPLLVDYFLSRYARAAGIERPPLAQNALDALVNYSWPGNVRELEHLIQRLMIFAGGYTIQAHDLPWTVRTDPQAPAGEADPAGEEQWLSLIRAHLASYAGNHACEELLEKIERLLIVEALRRSQGNQTHAARLLGLPRPTLHARMQKYGMHGREAMP